MKPVQFLFQISIIVLLWKCIWGLFDMSVDNICEDNKKLRAVIYFITIVALLVLYSVNPDHFIHA